MEHADLEKLRQILLENEQKALKKTTAKVDSIQNKLETIDERIQNLKQQYQDISDELQNVELLAEKVNPLFDKRLKRLKNEFQYTFNDELRSTIKDEITSEPEYLVEAIAPVLGKVVVQYVGNTVQTIMDYINSMIAKLRPDTNKNTSEDNQLQTTEIQEIFLIQNQTGILLGSYSQNQITDLDLVAAMLTAIISFSKDVFNTDTEIKVIELKDYKILIEKDEHHYAGIVLKGILNETIKQQLYHFLQEFYTQYLPPPTANIDNKLFAETSKKLTQFFKKYHNIS